MLVVTLKGVRGRMGEKETGLIAEMAGSWPDRIECSEFGLAGADKPRQVVITRIILHLYRKHNSVCKGTKAHK